MLNIRIRVSYGNRRGHYQDLFTKRVFTEEGWDSHQIHTRLKLTVFFHNKVHFRNLFCILLLNNIFLYFRFGWSWEHWWWFRVSLSQCDRTCSFWWVAQFPVLIINQCFLKGTCFLSFYSPSSQDAFPWSFFQSTWACLGIYNVLITDRRPGLITSHCLGKSACAHFSEFTPKKGSSCFMLPQRDKLQPEGPLGLYADLLQ